jgi:hypothetical protein
MRRDAARDVTHRHDVDVPIGRDALRGQAASDVSQVALGLCHVAQMPLAMD